LKKEINIYLTLSEEDQLFTSAERIAKNGLKIPMIVERYEDKSNI
jgi:hypothetical protein